MKSLYKLIFMFLTIVVLIASGCHSLFPVNNENEITIKRLMMTNGGCSLPCFWGITPSVTSWKDAEENLKTLGATIDQVEIKPGENYKSVRFEGDSLTTGDNFGFLEIMDVVDVILVSGNLYGSTRNINDFTSLWASYSPREIVSKYGIPSRVFLSSVFAPGFGDTGRRGYLLWIFYDLLGIMIRYDGSVADLPIYHICPQFQKDEDITRIDLVLQNPSNLSPLELHDSILAESVVPRVILTIEDSAGINTEEFYNLFANGESQACFDTPREIWKVEN